MDKSDFSPSSLSFFRLLTPRWGRGAPGSALSSCEGQCLYFEKSVVAFSSLSAWSVMCDVVGQATLQNICRLSWLDSLTDPNEVKSENSSKGGN